MSFFKNPVLLAKIGAPHGVRGEVRVTSFTQEALAFGSYGKLHTKDGRSFTVAKARPAKNVLVVNFKEIQNRDDAEKSRGLELFVERDVLPDTRDADEFYVDDLIGMEVQDQDALVIGKILAVPNFGAGDLLEISPKLVSGRFSNDTWFLEFTQNNVPDIDFTKKIVHIVKPSEISERDE